MFGGFQGRERRRLAGRRLAVIAAAIGVAMAPQGLSQLPVAASATSAAPRQAAAKALPRRHHIKHQKLSKQAAAAIAARVARQTPASASTVPVVGGQWNEAGPKPIASVGAPEGEVAGRVTAIAYDPNDASGPALYIGTADGGVWKTNGVTSASATWTPVFDSQTTLAIGAIAVAPHAAGTSATVYVGTGEPDDCYDCLPGQGVFKSTDGGSTWSQLAGAPVHPVTAIVVDRSKSNDVLVATTAGLWTSADAGATWIQNTQLPNVTAQVSSGTPASGGIDSLVQDPVNDHVFWAAMGDWCDTESGSIVTSSDSGATWSQAPNFPTVPNATRLTVALGKDSSNHVVAYAAIAACAGSGHAEGQLLGIAKNPDADGTGQWTLIQPGPSLPDFFAEPGPPVTYQGWYDITAAVDPTNPNVAVFGGVTMLLTTDGGAHFSDIARPYSTDATNPPLLHPDFHAALFTGASSFYAGNDGGIWYTSDAGSSYTNLNHTLGITQFYAGSSLNSSYLVGGSQDNGTVGFLPSNKAGDPWPQLQDGDGRWTALDPTSGSHVVWAELPHLDLYKGAYDTAASNWTETGPCSGGCKENTEFIAPFVMDPKNPSRLYAGSTYVYTTADGGTTWSPSADLTYASTSYAQDDIHTMAVASGPSGTVLLTGSNYGRVEMTTAADGSGAWVDISAGLPAYNANLTTGNAWISGLALNPSNTREAWATIGIASGARVFHTVDGGTTWSDLTGAGAAAVPNVVIDSIAVDPQHPQTIFIGTDAGALVCGTCGGATAAGSWAPLGAGLPNARVDALTFTSDDSTLVAWTHGRGVWMLSNAPRVVLDPKSLDFGNQAVGSTSAAKTVTLTDQGTMPVTISSIAAGGDYGESNTCPPVVAPGASCTISVTFSPSAPGTRTGSVTVTDDAADSPQSVALTGNGTAASAGTLTPGSIDFGKQEVGTTSVSKAATLTNNGTASMTITSIATSGDFGETDNCPKPPTTLAMNTSCTIDVTFSPQTSGARSGKLTVTDDAPNSPQSSTLSGTGVQANAALVPSSLTFPGQHVKTTSAGQPITLSNSGNEALTISNIGTSGDFAQTNDCGTSLAANSSCTITVTFTPTATGTRTGTLTVSDNAPGGQQKASLSGTGTQPQASLAPPSLTFSGQPVGTTSAAQTITLSNLGNETLVINGIAASGDFGQTNTCGAALAANSSCTIDVTFTPSASGTRTGSVTVNDNAPGSPQSASLTGTGTQPTVLLSPSSLTFGAQDVTTSSSAQVVTLLNNGNQTLAINSIGASGDFGQTNNCGSSLSAQTSCSILVTFTPSSAGLWLGTLTVNDDAPGSPHTVALSGQGVLHFYFAEGFTGPGFSETLSILAPDHNANATIDYFMPGWQKEVRVKLTAGQVWTEPVNRDVGADQNVSARVMLDQNGVVERTIHFNTGSWDGSTDEVGVTQPRIEWDFAEGSTLPEFSEYLTLENPNGVEAPVTLNYVTNTENAATKSMTLPAGSRTTVEVFSGSLTSGCSVINGMGVGCGVGRSFEGVSVQVLSQGPPIIAERPFYVNGFSFGSGAIRDGHDAFGANGRQMQWNFAEGTTLGGFNEYLTLQNTDPINPSIVDINYFNQDGIKVTKTLGLPQKSRTTIEVFNGSFTTGTCSVVNGRGVNCGVGPGIQGVSAQVVVHAGSPPIVVERPMYMIYGNQNGPGRVAGATDVVGATQLATSFDFAWGSTLPGDDDYLTIGNPTPNPATLTITYYGAKGPITQAHTVSVGSHFRATVHLWDPPASGAGPGQAVVGIIITSTQPVQIEKPTYSSNAATYGATDTAAYSPSGS